MGGEGGAFCVSGPALGGLRIWGKLRGLLWPLSGPAARHCPPAAVSPPVLQYVTCGGTRRNMHLDFTGQTVLITGAAAGIGLATSRAFLESGALLWMADINASTLEQSARDLSAEGFAPHTRVCDVRDPEQVDALVAAVLADQGRLDVMVNNVGVSHFTALTETATPDWRATLEVTLDSCFYGVRAALRPMREQGSGAIVNISSGAGLRGTPRQGSYGVAKAGVINLTQVAAVENAAAGVRINCVAPGPIATPPMLAWMEKLPNRGEEFLRSQVAGRLGEPEEIAAAVLFLASAQASYINGQTLAVDGGVTSQLVPGL